MEITSFVLGILSVIGVAVVTLVVVGMVKIYQLIKQHNSVLQELNQVRSNLHQSIGEESRYIHQRLNEMDRQAENVYRDWETDRKSTRLNSSH